MTMMVITGASRGIGRATALRLAREGQTVLLTGRDEAGLAETRRQAEAQGASVQTVVADLAEPAGCQRVIEATNERPIAALVNNAGVAPVAPFEAITLEQWQAALAVNVTAPFLLCQGLRGQMQRGTTIVNVLSVAARTGFPNWSAYCMTKAALDGFSRSLREELRSEGIRVVTVYPAATQTEIWRGIPGNWPTEHMLAAEEVAEAIAYAISRPSSVLVEQIDLGHIRGAL